VDAGLYIHIPFCQARCAYCDFNTYAGLQSLHADYVSALVREIEGAGPARVRTIYIGGGTPTVLPPSLLARILDAVRRRFSVAPDVEITVEANPGTVDAATLEDLLTLGINRLSLGVQSFHDDELRLLGRSHSMAQAVDTLDAARRAGLDNVSIDLIYGLPGQALDAWQASLDRALALRPAHLSLYALSLEPGTPLAAAVSAGRLPAPDPDLAAEMYERARTRCAAAGYLHYELSNWARAPALRCRHNLRYWRNEPYLGIGAGAHAYHVGNTGGRRSANVAHPADYVERLASGMSPAAWQEEIGRTLAMGETMMLGLRLVEEGVAFDRFHARFGTDLVRTFAGALDELAPFGLVERCSDRVRLTPRGHLLANQALYRFLPDERKE
jgi:oxygen-independent coproporphyrinogen-3 oxidase